MPIQVVHQISFRLITPLFSKCAVTDKKLFVFFSFLGILILAF